MVIGFIAYLVVIAVIAGYAVVRTKTTATMSSAGARCRHPWRAFRLAHPT